MKLVVILLTVVVLGLSAITAYQLSIQNNAIRTIMCLAQKQTLTSKQRTAEEKRVTVEFYREALASIGAAPCPLPPLEQ